MFSRSCCGGARVDANIRARRRQWPQAFPLPSSPFSEMRAPPNESTSTSGQSEVKAAFERLQWAPVENPYHDIGTDLWIAARDARRFDLGLMVGAQVKSGESWFSEPVESEDGQEIGWWFREDQEHFDYWLAHAVPHLVVLYDPRNNVSFWAHITNDSVTDTGKNSKILVPVENVVGEACRNALTRVAAAGAAGVPWEGSIWMAGADIPPARHLRHALIVPRLIAPHPNAGHEKAPTIEQVIAMLMQARLPELRRLSEDFAEIPPMHEAVKSSEWAWQFLGALWERVTKTEVDLLLDRAGDAPGPAARAAAAVAAASALIEVGECEQAIDLLSIPVGRDDCDPVDLNWLLVQRARALAEIGRLEAAHDDAVAAQGTRLLAPNDATAGAITASASVLLFNTAEWQHRDVRSVMESSDTAAGWWRSQVISRALGATLDRTFKEWANDGSVTLGGEDVSRNQLEVASLLASHTGDQAGWRNQAGRQAADALVRVSRNDDPEEAARALDALRMAGDHNGVVLAVRHLGQSGPAEAVTLAGRNVDLTRSTRTTGYSDLKFLQVGGDLTDPAIATAAAGEIFNMLDGTSDFPTRTGQRHPRDVQVIETLAGILAAAEIEGQREAVARLRRLAPQEHQLPAEAWGKVLAALPRSAFDAADGAVLATQASQHHVQLSRRMLGIAARLGNADARDALTQQALQGSLDALSELGDVRELDAAVVREQIARLARSARKVVADAQRGSFDIGADVCHPLVLLNIWHPGLAQWDAVLELLGADAVMVNEKRRALRLLADQTERIPENIRQPLTETVIRIARQDGNVMYDPLTSPRDASAEATLLAMALGAFDGDETSAHLTRLLNGAPSDRAWAAVIAGRNDDPFNRGLLVSLAADVDSEVRSAACAWLAYLAASSSDALLAAALRRAAGDPGRSVVIQLAFGLQRLEASEDEEARALGAELRASLTTNSSARVRALAQSLADEPEVG